MLTFVARRVVTMVLCGVVTSPSLATDDKISTSTISVFVDLAAGEKGQIYTTPESAKALEDGPTVTIGPGQTARFRVRNRNPYLQMVSATTIETEVLYEEADVAELVDALSIVLKGLRGPRFGSTDSIQDDIQILNERIVQIPEIITRSVDATPEERAAIVRDVAAWKIHTLVKNIRKRFPLVEDELLKQIQNGNIDTSSLTGIAILTLRSQIEEAVELLDTFRRATEQLKSSDESLVSIEYAANQRQTFYVVVGENGAFAKVATKPDRAHAKARAGSYIVTVDPKDDWKLVMSPAVAYSLVDTKTYAAVEDGAGNLIIREDDGEDVGLGAALLLDVVAPWPSSRVSFLLQVGAFADTDHPAFLLGGGLRIQNKYVMGVGWIRQETTRLRSGQTLGGVVASPDDLDIIETAVNGVYISVGAAL